MASVLEGQQPPKAMLGDLEARLHPRLEEALR
jgi:hypothetical protein